MRPRRLAVALLPAFACACSGGNGSGSATVTFNPVLYVGTWSGTWSNTALTTNGTADVTVTQIGTSYTIDLDLGGDVFGTTDPEPETFTANIGPTRATLVATTSDLLGDLTGSISPAATVRVHGAHIHGAAATFDLIGGVTPTQFALNVTITNDDDTIETCNAVLFKM
ncbi:MAG: hypothetical protein U1E73_12915 [Planctomycetota bacterium]